MIELTSEEARSIVFGDNLDWHTIKSDVVDNARWSTIHEGIFKHKSTGKCYKLGWSEGATECQDESPFEYSDPEPIEVEEKEVVVKQWVAVK
jgi:hypothetical protein